MIKMNEKQEESTVFTNRLQNILNSLSKCKTDFVKEKEEYRKIREINSKMEVELKEARELEKSHRYHLMTSRDMIGNLQETVSQLVYLKRDIKKLKEEIISKDITLSTMEKDKEIFIQKHNENVIDLRKSHEKHIEELVAVHENKIQQVQHESDIQIARLTCDIEELRIKVQEMQVVHLEKMNIVVLEYEEKLERSASQITQLQEQLARQAAKTDVNIDAYRRRLQELEEKLKQSQFKQYLAQSAHSSQYESRVERPYSVIGNPYPCTDTYAEDINTVFEESKTKFGTNPIKAPKQGALQVIHYGNKSLAASNNEKKGQFHISKKRKLYNEKVFQDF